MSSWTAAQGVAQLLAPKEHRAVDFRALHFDDEDAQKETLRRHYTEEARELFEARRRCARCAYVYHEAHNLGWRLCRYHPSDGRCCGYPADRGCVRCDHSETYEPPDTTRLPACYLFSRVFDIPQSAVVACVKNTEAPETSHVDVSRRE